jgi:hypothetical protein
MKETSTGDGLGVQKIISLKESDWNTLVRAGNIF